MAEAVVVDASAMIDLLVGVSAPSVRRRLAGTVLHAPAHLDAEVLSALGRLHRAGHLAADEVAAHLDAVAQAPIERHPLPALLPVAWAGRETLRLADALYVALAGALGMRLVTTDARLAAAAPVADLVES